MATSLGFSCSLACGCYTPAFAFLLEILALFIVVVTFLQEVHVLLKELVTAFMLQHISYPTFEFLPLL
jgi:hypothetical protein